MNQKILTGLPVFAVLSCFLPVLFLPKGAWYSPRYFLLSHEVPYWDFTPAFQILRAILRPFSLGILGLHLITLVAVALACGGLAYVQRPAA
ncbi:MAG: hypothetical protein KGQ54_03805, partial [Verrucomicrobia bacterium]|nr:hypothetical protein [Verrucomicrobiota bacterium]